MSRRPKFVTFDVGDGVIGALRWEGAEGAPTVLALHGLTGNAWWWDPVAYRLGTAAHVVAVDLRGRGRSVDVGGPFGIRRHADDVASIAQQLAVPVLVAGHSMGASVALMAAKYHRSISRLLLVDGGAPLPSPEGSDVDSNLAHLLGPSLARVQHVWSDRSSYYSMWANHPAFADGIGLDLERDLLADLAEVDTVGGGFRTTINELAVREDGRDLLTDDEVRSLLIERTTSTPIVRAPNGPLGVPPPLIPATTVAAALQHRWIDVANTNHYTVLMGDTGATAVATALQAELTG